jgi:hypothetical protein
MLAAFEATIVWELPAFLSASTVLRSGSGGGGGGGGGVERRAKFEEGMTTSQGQRSTGHRGDLRF